MSREDILLKEYEVCQQFISSRTSSHWTAATIFLGIIQALLGGVILGVMAQGLPSSGIVIGLVLALSLGMIFILTRLMIFDARMAFITRVNYERMREIEDELGMWAGRRIYGLDAWYDTSNQRNNMLEPIREKLLSYRPEGWWQSWKEHQRYAPPRGASGVKKIFLTLIILWGIVVLVFIALLLNWFIKSW